MAKATVVPTPRRMSRVLAVRRLHVPGQPTRTVTVRIGVPRHLSGGWDWGCPVEIAGLEDPGPSYIFGADAFQALQLALDYVAIRISTAAPRPYWFDVADGGGFTRSLPSVLPLAIQDELQGLINRAALRWASQGKRATAPRRRTRP
jgi:hypothetical protein